MERKFEFNSSQFRRNANERLMNPNRERSISSQNIPMARSQAEIQQVHKDHVEAQWRFVKNTARGTVLLTCLALIQNTGALDELDRGMLDILRFIGSSLQYTPVP